MELDNRWIIAPSTPAADPWLTVRPSRTVVVVIPTVVAGTTLLTLVQLFSSDPRIQVFFTVPAEPDVWHGVRAFVEQVGGVVLPWSQVLRMRFDLALAASYRGIHQVNAPAMIFPHGIGTLGQKLGPVERCAPNASHRLSRNVLLYNGRVIPSALMLTHDSELEILEQSCPEALPAAVVAGDLIYDQLVASVHLREAFRTALGVRRDQRLVVVSSTWSQFSLLGSEPEVFSRLAGELDSPECLVVAVLHPNIWSVHGSWQIKAWLKPYLDRNHGLLPPERGWQAAVIAADVMIGDHGSVTLYGAALGKPVIMNPGSVVDERPGSIAALVRASCARLEQDRPLLAQVQSAIGSCSAAALDRIGDLVTSRPGESAAIIRAAGYRLLRLPEPLQPPVLPALAAPDFA